MVFKIKKILVPIAFSKNCDIAKDYADELAKQFKAKVKLLHVVEQSPYEVYMQRGIMEDVPLYERAGAALPSANQKFIIKDVVEETRKELERMKKADGVSYEYEVRHGHTVDEIVREIESYDPDVVVVATHGHTGLKHLVLGSVTEKVVRLSPKPVLTVPIR